jgi:hypothetical protein
MWVRCPAQQLLGRSFVRRIMTQQVGRGGRLRTLAPVNNSAEAVRDNGFLAPSAADLCGTTVVGRRSFCGAIDAGGTPATPQCEQEGCTSLKPMFGSDSDGVARRCSTHARAWDVDVVSPRCEQSGCTGPSKFGNQEDGVPRYCRKHKKMGDVNVLSTANRAAPQDSR